MWGPQLPLVIILDRVSRNASMHSHSAEAGAALVFYFSLCGRATRQSTAFVLTDGFYSACVISKCSYTDRGMLVMLCFKKQSGPCLRSEFNWRWMMKLYGAYSIVCGKCFMDHTACPEPLARVLNASLARSLNASPEQNS